MEEPKQDALQLFTEQSLATFSEVITEEDLQKLVKEYSGLKVKDIDDREGLMAVRKARIDLKNKVVEIKKKGKSLRESAVSFQKAVITRENELVNIIDPSKKELEEEEDRIAALKEAKRQEDEKRESDRIQARMDQLNAVEHAHDFHQLKTMSDEQFAELLKSATDEFAEIQIKREEDKKREEIEAKDREQKRIAEENALAILRKEQEEKQRKFDEKQAAFRAEQDKAKKEQEAREAKLREEQAKVEAEKQAIREAKEAEEAEKKRLADLEAARKTAAEQAIKDKEEADRKAKEEEEERIKSASDKERFKRISDLISMMQNESIWSLFTSKSGKVTADQIQEHLKQAAELAKFGATRKQGK